MENPLAFALSLVAILFLFVGIIFVFSSIYYLDDALNSTELFCEKNNLKFDGIIPIAQCKTLDENGVIRIYKISKFDGEWHFIKFGEEE